MSNYIAYTENLSGSSFSGVDGSNNRTYTISNLGVVNSAFLVQLDGYLLHQYHDFVVNGQVLTILVPVFNTSVITLNYLVSTGGVTPPASSSYYTTASLVSNELRLTTALSSSTTPALDTVQNWIQEESKMVDLTSGEVYSSQLVSSDYNDYDGSGVFRFPFAPLLSVIEVKYNENSLLDNPSWVSLESGFGKNYLEYLGEGEIEFISGMNATNKVLPLSGKKKLCVSYSYGYANIPLEIQRLTTLMVTKRFIMSLINNQANSEGGEIQVGTIRVADPSDYSTKYINNLSAEINDSLSKMGRNFKTFRFNRMYD